MNEQDFSAAEFTVAKNASAEELAETCALVEQAIAQGVCFETLQASFEILKSGRALHAAQKLEARIDELETGVADLEAEVADLEAEVADLRAAARADLRRGK